MNRNELSSHAETTADLVVSKTSAQSVASA